VREVSGAGAPTTSIPTQLDAMFVAAQVLFQKIAIEIGPVNQQDTFAFTGAQWIFYLTLWAAFGIFDTVSILTKVLIAIGPLMLVGYLFEATREVAVKWLSQLISYGILLLLLNIVATVVILAEAAALTVMAGVISIAGTTAAKIIGLYEIDMLFLTGNALIIALPTIAGNLGGALSSQDQQQPPSVGRNVSASGAAARRARNKLG